MDMPCTEGKILKWRVWIWVLVVNVGPPTFVSLLSIVHFLSYFCPSFISHLSHLCPLSHFCLVCVFRLSVLSWSGLVFVIIGLKTVPLLSSFDPLSQWDKYWTSLGLNHFSIFYLVTLLLDKRRTILGHQSWICPLFVQAPYSCYNFLYFTEQLDIIEQPLHCQYITTITKLKGG